MKSPEFTRKPSETPNPEKTKNPLEGLTNTQEFFQNTARGQDIATRIEVINKYILENTTEIEDLKNLNTSGLIAVAESCALTGKPYQTYVDEAINDSIGYNSSVIANDNFQKILDFYISLRIPPDDNVVKILEHFKKKINDNPGLTIDDHTEIHLPFGLNSDDILKMISVLYIRNGDVKQAQDVIEKIRDPRQKERQMLVLNLRLNKDDPTREANFTQIENTILESLSKDFSTNDANKDLLHLIHIYIHDNQIDRALGLIDFLKNPTEAVGPLMDIAVSAHGMNLPVEDIFNKAIRIAENQDSGFENMYQNIIAGYINIGDLVMAGKLLSSEDVQYPAQFLEKIKTERLLDPIVSDFVIQYIKK